MKNLTKIFFLIYLSGCAHPSPAINTLEIKDSKFEKKLDFTTSEEAKAFFYDRRLQLQRLYQLNAEPYFGTPKEKDCKDSVDTSAVIKKNNRSQYFSMKLLANDYLALGDCLPENNTRIAIYEFKVCDKTVYEVRTYYPLGSKTSETLDDKCLKDRD